MEGAIDWLRRKQLGKLAMRFLQGVLVPLVAVAAAVVISFLPLIAINDKETAALVTAGLLLASVTLLLYATGRKERTAVGDITYTPSDSGEAKTISGGQAVPSDVFKQLGDEQKTKVSEQRGLYFRALYVGADGRWSTSKLQALLWTYAIVFALVALAVGELHGVKFFIDGEKVSFGDLPFREEYLIFLGGPYAAAVIAKASTAGKVENGTMVKPPAGAGSGGEAGEGEESGEGEEGTSGDVEATGSGLAKGTKEVISSDTGRTDLLDLQYLFFNLIALGVFLGTFVVSLENGLPKIPLFLVGLTGTSALAYATKKTVESATPTIDSVVPSSAYPGETLTVEGQHLLMPHAIAPRAMIDGRKVRGKGVVVKRGTAADSVATLLITVPTDAESGTGKKLVLTPVGAKAPASAEITIRGPEIEAVQPPSPALLPGATIVISGKGFKGERPDDAGLRLGTLPLTVENWTDTEITATLPTTIGDDDVAQQGAKVDLRLAIPGRGTASHPVTLTALKSNVDSASPKPLLLQPGARLIVTGTGFGKEVGNLSLDELGELAVEDWTDTVITAVLPPTFASPDGRYATATSVALRVNPRQGRPPTTSSVEVLKA